MGEETDQQRKTDLVEREIEKSFLVGPTWFFGLVVANFVCSYWLHLWTTHAAAWAVFALVAFLAQRLSLASTHEKIRRLLN